MLEEAAVSIVMGLDQHRAQITAEWLDTETGEAEIKRRWERSGEVGRHGAHEGYSSGSF